MTSASAAVFAETRAYDAIKMVPRTEPDPNWDTKWIMPGKEYTLRVKQEGNPELHIAFKHPESFESGREVLRKYAEIIAERQVTGIPKVMYERG